MQGIYGGFIWNLCIGYKEAIDFVTICIFRGLFRDKAIYFRSDFDFLSVGVMLLHVYILCCSRTLIFLPVILAKCIRKWATIWSRRVMIILGTKGKFYIESMH